MRRLVPLLVIAALLPLGGSSASACAPPDEGPPRCCESHLVSVTVGDHTVSVPDPRIRVDCA